MSLDVNVPMVATYAQLKNSLTFPDFFYSFAYPFPDLVDCFRVVLGQAYRGLSDGFLFKKIIVRYKKIGYNIDVLRRTACLVVKPIMVDSFAYLFNCITVGRASD